MTPTAQPTDLYVYYLAFTYYDAKTKGQRVTGSVADEFKFLQPLMNKNSIETAAKAVKKMVDESHGMSCEVFCTGGLYLRTEKGETVNA